MAEEVGGAGEGDPAPGAPDRASNAPGVTLTFRQPRTSLVFAVALLVSVAPVALLLPVLLPLLLFPVGVLVWVVRSRTVVDGRGLRLQGLRQTRQVAWPEVAAMDARPRGLLSTPVHLRLTSGEELGLPQVTRRDVPTLRAVAEGRDPRDHRPGEAGQ